VDDGAKKTVAGLERHAITALTLVIVALILWVGNGVQQTQVKLAAIEVELTYIKQGLNSDSGKMNDIEKRLDRIEQQLNMHMGETGK
jgi:hypothetical protein